MSDPTQGKPLSEIFFEAERRRDEGVRLDFNEFGICAARMEDEIKALRERVEQGEEECDRRHDDFRRDLAALRERVEALEEIVKATADDVMKLYEPILKPSPEDAAKGERWPDPSEAMLSDWRFEAIWQAIKKWDINVPGVYKGYMGATGNHARAILDSISRAEGPALHKIEEEKAHAFVPPPPPAGERGSGERIYPCAKCGLLRSKEEGGTTFTVCDGCWDEEYPPRHSSSSDTPQAQGELCPHGKCGLHTFLPMGPPPTGSGSSEKEGK